MHPNLKCSFCSYVLVRVDRNISDQFLRLFNIWYFTNTLYRKSNCYYQKCTYVESLMAIYPLFIILTVLIAVLYIICDRMHIMIQHSYLADFRPPLVFGAAGTNILLSRALPEPRNIKFQDSNCQVSFPPYIIGKLWKFIGKFYVVNLPNNIACSNLTGVDIRLCSSQSKSYIISTMIDDASSH